MSVAPVVIDPRGGKQPSGNGWQLLGSFAFGQIWESGPVRVVSSLDNAQLPQREEAGPQWHVSISNVGKRPKAHHVRRALRARGMVGAEEDNHHPGAARHFWMPVDPAARVACECKDDEVTVVEADGYTWSNDPNNCRGCDLARTLRHLPCSIHGGAL